MVFLRSTVRESGRKIQSVAGSDRVHEREAEQAFGDHGAQATSDEIQRKFFEEVLVLEEMITEVENELYEANGEMRKLTVERRKVEVSVTSRVSKWRTQISTSLTIYGSDSDKSKNVNNGNNSFFFRVEERTTVIFQGSFAFRQ